MRTRQHAGCLWPYLRDPSRKCLYPARATNDALWLSCGRTSPTCSTVSPYSLRYAVTHLALADNLEELSQLLLHFDFWEALFEKGAHLHLLSTITCAPAQAGVHQA